MLRNFHRRTKIQSFERTYLKLMQKIRSSSCSQYLFTWMQEAHHKTKRAAK